MIFTALKVIAQLGLTFAAIWTALYTSGTLEQLIPEWVGPEMTTISDDVLFMTSGPIDSQPEPEVIGALIVGTMVLSVLVVVAIKRLRAWA